MIADRFPSVRMAWGNLWRNRVRTVLAALGILIGVVAIAGLGIAGTALQYGASQQFEGLTDRVQIGPGPEFVEPIEDDRRGVEDRPPRAVAHVGGRAPPVDRRLGVTHIERIEAIAPNATVIPIKRHRMTIETRTDRQRVSAEVVDRPGPLYNVSEGSIPRPFYSGALVSERVASDLNIGVGDRVVIGDRSMTVRATLTDEGFGTRYPDVVISGPIDRRGYDQVTIIAEDGDRAQSIAAAVKATFNDQREVLAIRSRADLNERRGEFFSIINLVLMGIGSISLFVASVSILNVLLMSTIERRGEIGILRAVGITRFEVLRMILTEAALLGVLGGAAGAVVATGIGALLYHGLFDDATLVFQWRNVRFLLAAFGFGTLASVISGVYPAWKAATADPVEAIRS